MVHRTSPSNIPFTNNNAHASTNMDVKILHLDNITATETSCHYKDRYNDENFRCFFNNNNFGGGVMKNLTEDLNLKINLSNQPVTEKSENNVVSIGDMNFLNDLGDRLPVWQYDEFSLEKFSEGYFGKIFKATHCPTNRLYILKVLKDDSAIDPDDVDSGTSGLTGSGDGGGNEEYKEMFLEEIKLLSKLNHTNILKFCGVTFLAHQICYLSEYVRGGTLQELIRNHSSLNVSWNDYLHIMLDIAKGMAYLHNTNIIHRDLNSKNVVMKPLDGKIRYQAIIIDFGLSYQKPDISTSEDEVPVGAVGSPFHIAPELFHDVPCSTQTDVFSYGIMLCEVISGCPGADPDDVPRTNDFGLNVEEFSEMASDCPAELLNLAVRCCQLKSTLRPKFIDIVKIIDIILDIYAEIDDEIFENFSASLNLETSMLCLCMARRKRLLYRQNSNFKTSLPDSMYDSERRFSITENVSEVDEYNIQNASPNETKLIDCNGNLANRDKDNQLDNTVTKRPINKPILKNRCSLCGGRILSRASDIVDSNSNVDIKRDGLQKIHNNKVWHSTSSENSSFENDQITTKENSNQTLPSGDTVITPTKTIPIKVTIPSPEHKSTSPTPTSKYFNENEIHLPEQNPYFSSLERSMKYPAGIYLKSNRHSISNRTTQMATNTPGVLPRFFHQIMRKRKSRIMFHPGHSSLEHTPSRKLLPAFLRKTFSHGSLVKLNVTNTAEEESFSRRTLTYSHANDKTFLKNRRGSMPLHKGGFSMPGSPTGHESKRFPMFTYSSENITEGENPYYHVTANSSKQNHKRTRSLLDLFFKRKTSN